LNKITFSINYITNFRPNLAAVSNNPDFFKFDKKKRLISRNFFLFMSSMKFFKQNNIFNRSSIFIKKFKKNVQTILRSPYRHKLTRHQLILNRYYVVQKLDYILNNNIIIKKNNELNQLVKNIKKFYSWFESNIVYHHKVLIFHLKIIF
jgi:hypothetical protein